MVNGDAKEAVSFPGELSITKSEETVAVVPSVSLTAPPLRDVVTGGVTLKVIELAPVGRLLIKQSMV